MENRKIIYYGIYEAKGGLLIISFITIISVSKGLLEGRPFDYYMHSPSNSES
jgi:hypothetical protein